MKKRNKILVGMSGGVDSSVAALILKNKGFEVSGAFMNLSDDKQKKNEVKKIADALEIPFFCFDFRKEFKKRIILNFIEEYKKGTTPNPCVECNKEIKFGLFLEKAISLGFDYVATGHYAQIQKSKTEKFELLKGKDKNKDQSYFLWRLNQKQLQKILFPLGNYIKEKVREKAKKYKIASFNAKESQEICFIENKSFDFLKKYIKEKKGDIVDIQGEKIGKHQGLYFYTIGQRKRIGLSDGPYFVIKKDFRNNFLVVSKNENDLFSKELIVKDVNWISGIIPKFPLKVKVKIRYRHQSALAILTQNLKTYNLKFNKPQRAITSGQSAVFYQGEKLLGGGIIKEII